MAEIDLTPTEEMAANAARGLELRRKHGKGGTEIGVARARDISNRKNLSPETVRRMHAFFSRHEKNKAGGEDDAGYIAWMLWSGDAGRDWAKRKVEQMDKGENQRSDTYKEIAQRLGSAAKFAITKEQIRGASREELRSIEQRLQALAKSGDKNAAALLDYVEEEYNDRYRGTHSRPGAKAKMQNASWMQHVSNMLRDLTNERQRVQVWIAGPTTIKVAGMWMAYTRYGKGAAIASRMAYYLTQAAGTPGKYSGQDIKDSPRKGTNTTIWTVSNVPEDAVSYLKAWGIGTSPKAFAGFTGESAVSYARPGAKAKMGMSANEKAMLVAHWNAVSKLLKEARDRLFAAERAKDEAERLKAIKDIQHYSAQRDAATATLKREGLMSRPGAKAKMGNAEDVRSLLAQAEQMIWTAKRPEQKREVMELVKDAERMIDASMPSGFRMRLDRLKQRIASEFSRFGGKVKMAVAKDYDLAVTDSEYAALIAGDAVSKKIQGDSQYQITPEDRAIRERAKAAMQSAQARWDNWQKMWERATTDAERAAIEARATDAESKMRKYRVRTPKSRASRPGAKVANAVRKGEKVSAADDAVSRKIRKLMDEGKPQKQAVAIALDLERRGEL